MKRIVKLTSILICIIFILSALSNTFAAEGLTTSTSKIEAKDKKIYANATIEQDFVDNHVLVVMDRSVSAINKTHEFSSLRSVSITNVKDLTRIDTTQENTLTSVAGLSKEQIVSRQKLPLVNMDAFRQIFLLELPTHSKSNVLEVIKKLESVDGIMYAGPDYCSYPCSTGTNDTYYDEQWAIEKIQLDDAWDITTGSSTVYVGVIDSGIASHPDLNANVVTGWDFYNENSITNDDIRSHGTHVAGIISAVGNNGNGISGSAWNVKLVPLQITRDNRGSFNYSDVIEAIMFAINNSIAIINNSNGTYLNDAAFKQAIANYQGLFVCSAGNDVKDIDQELRYPSSYKLENVISVANSTADDTLYYKLTLPNGTEDGSNYGKNTVHLTAPGTSILSCVPIEICESGCYQNEENIHYVNGYHYYTGTSMAAPYVTGVAALIKSCRPDLSALEIKELILENVDEIPALADKCITGGRLNAYKAVLAATEAPTFIGDVNGDGRDDVILSRKINNKRALTVYLGQSNGGFSEPVTTQTTDYFSYEDRTFVGDFNGDGLTDVVVHWTSNGYRQLLVYRGKADGTFYSGSNMASSSYYDAALSVCDFHIADVDGDGKDDFIVHHRLNTGCRGIMVYKGTASSPYFVNTSSYALVTYSDYYYPNEPSYTGDFNGDGFADLVVHKATDNNKRQLVVFTGTSSGTFNSGATLTSTRNHIEADYPTRKFVADVNGDGKDDFIVHWKTDNGYRSVLVYTGTSTSPYLIDAATDALSSTNTYNEKDPVFVGDINGDERTDLIVHQTNTSSYRQLLTYTANSNGTYNQATQYSTYTVHDPSVYFENLFVADINGDGRDDLVVKRKNSNNNVQFLTYLGTTSGSFASALTTSPSTFVAYFDGLNAAQNGTYKITNVGAGKCLNIYGDNVTYLSYNQNVTLWEDSGTNEQKWLISALESNVFIKSVINQSYGLNVYRAGSPWNCDVYPVEGNETDALIDIIQTSNGYKIKLHNYNLYLTVNSSSNGANVYWDYESTSTYQLWNFTLVQ